MIGDRRTLLVAAVTAALVRGATGVAAARGGGQPAGLPAPTGWTAVVTLLVGTALLMISVEVLIHALVRTAVRFRVSPFLLAVAFSGVEFDNLAFGVVTGFRELQGVAFGLAVGNAITIFGLTLALGAVLVPFTVEVPRDYLALMTLAPLVLVPVLLAGAVTAVHGGLLVLAYGATFGYVVRRERATDRVFMRSPEVRKATTVADGSATRLPSGVDGLLRTDWFWPAVMVVAVGGVVVGAEGSAAGVEGVIQSWNLGGTLLGLTAVTILYTIDDLLLIVEPLRLGYEDVAVGGVVGSLLFFVTANVGVVALVGTIDVTPPTLYFHFPALVGFTALAGYFLRRGRMTRTRGLVLLGAYVLYLLAAVRLFAVVPIIE